VSIDPKLTLENRLTAVLAEELGWDVEEDERGLRVLTRRWWPCWKRASTWATTATGWRLNPDSWLAEL
jgi:hypothetical protein